MKLLKKIPKDEWVNPHPAVITYCLMAICIIFFILNKSSNGLLLDLFKKDNALVKSGQWYRLFTCAFVHTGPGHMLGNLFSMFVFGRFVERRCGRLKMAIIMLSSCLAGSLASLAMNPADSVGASGICFGIMGSFFGVIYNDDDTVHDVTRFIVMYIIINFIVSIFSSGIDNWAHIGGFLGGLFMGLFLGYYKEDNEKLRKPWAIILYASWISVFILSAYGVIFIPHLSIMDIIRGIN